MTKADWAAKDSAIHLMAAYKIAAGALTHTLPADPSLDDLNVFFSRCAHIASAVHRAVIAEREEQAVPFE